MFLFRKFRISEVFNKRNFNLIKLIDRRYIDYYEIYKLKLFYFFIKFLNLRTPNNSIYFLIKTDFNLKFLSKKVKAFFVIFTGILVLEEV
jgi:hypothetical protein